MNVDPSSWIVGIGPIALFLIGAYKVWQLLTRRIEPNNSNIMSVFGVAGGVVVIGAWLVGYAQHSDFDFWKFAWLTILGTAVVFAIGSFVVPQSQFGKAWAAKIKKRSIWQVIGNVVYSLAVIGGVAAIFWYVEYFLSDGRECGTSIRCNASEFLLGGRTSPLGFLWFFTFFSILALGALLVNIWLLFSKRKAD